MTDHRAPKILLLDRLRAQVIFDVFLVILLAGLIGALTGGLASGFMWAYFHIKPWLFAAPLDTPPSWRWLGIMAMPIIGGVLAAFIIRHLTRSHLMTPADVILAVHVKEGALNLRHGLGSYLASFIAIAFGNSVGQYGPMVQMGATIGHGLERLPYLKRPYAHVAIACGVAAAISAAFQAPIAGIVFALEVLLRFFSLQLFAPITVSAVTAFMVSRELFGRQVLFSIPWKPTLFPAEYAFFTLLGILSGLAAAGFIKFILFVQKDQRIHSLPLTVRLALAGALTGLLALAFPQILGSSTHELYLTVLGGVPLLILLGVFVTKFVATGFSLGSGMPGGILSPSMYLGATLGGSMGYLVHALFPYGTNDVPLYALVGMGSMASAAIGGPLSIILFVMEVTGNYEIISFVMTGVVMANLVAARLIGSTSLFDLQLQGRGFDIGQGRESIPMQQHIVGEIAHRDFARISPQTPLLEARKTLIETGQMEAFATDIDHHYHGYITLVLIDTLLETGADPQTPCAEFLRQNAQVLYQGHTLHHALHMAERFDLDHIPVLESEANPRLVGIIYENELVTHSLEGARISADMRHKA